MFMGISPIFSAENWSRVPFHFWSVAFFVFGSMVGSFLNVCIYRLPRGESIVFPPSHCPHCNYSIPWYLNIPLVTWPWLGGKCANCGAPISVRYFLIELLTAVMFLACWLAAGHVSALLALTYCLLVAGLITASFIDIEHFIIPDGLNFGGMVAGLACSIAVPALHQTHSRLTSFGLGLLGLAFGAGLIYLVVRIGKLALGRRIFHLGADDSVIFTESAVVLPGEEISYGEIFYRKTDTVLLHAATVELCDRCYQNVSVKLTSSKLWIGDEELDPEAVPFMQVKTAQLVVPREVMGLGDVKFMAFIGSFLGWQAAIFSLCISSFIGAAVGLMLIALKRHEKSRPMQYGPFIALAAAIWIFGGRQLWQQWTGW